MDFDVLAFDLFGTLVDPLRLAGDLEALIGHGGRAAEVAAVWRQKQLEFTFRLTAMGTYEDFFTVTRKALDYALLLAGLQISVVDRARRMGRYGEMAPFPDARRGLEALQASGVRMGIFSNGTREMIAMALRSARLDAFFPLSVSVDEVRVYKPSPTVYRHAAERLGAPIERVCLVTANPFDVVGAQNAGMGAAWINRSGAPWDTLAVGPAWEFDSLDGLAAALAGGR